VMDEAVGYYLENLAKRKRERATFRDIAGERAFWDDLSGTNRGRQTLGPANNWG
jgi:hypothetical protein